MPRRFTSIFRDKSDSASAYIANRRSKRLYRYSIDRRAAVLIQYIQRFNCPAGSRILDVGTADGLVLDQVQKRFTFRCIGVDIRLDHLQAAWGRIPHLVQADGRALPFPGCTFDLVISTAVFKHVPGLDSLVAECGRVLKPGGRLIVVDPTPWGIRLGLLFGHLSRASIFQALNLEEWERLLSRQSLVIIGQERFMLAPVPFPGCGILEQGLKRLGADRLLLNQVICAQK